MPVIILNARPRIDYSELVDASNPIVYYECDDSSGNLADSSGNGFTGTASNLTYSQTGLIYQGTCVDFNGSSSDVSFNPTGMAYTNATFECWFNADTVDAGVGFYAGTLVSISDTGDNDNFCAIGLQEGTVFFVYRANTGFVGMDYWQVRSNFVHSTGTTYHLAVVSGSPSPDFYVNGQIQTKVTDYGTPNGQWFGNLAGENAAYMGRLRISGFDDWFDGRIDEFAHYNTQLSAGTILSHYNTGKI